MMKGVCDLGCCMYDDGCLVTRAAVCMMTDALVTWAVVCLSQEEFVFNQQTVDRNLSVVGKCEKKIVCQKFLMSEIDSKKSKLYTQINEEQREFENMLSPFHFGMSVRPIFCLKQMSE